MSDTALTHPYAHHRRRYTSFALESIQCTFSGSIGFGKRTTVTIPRNGDLLHTVWVELTMKKHASNASHFPAEQLLKEVELEIGGQRVRHVIHISSLIFRRLVQYSHILTRVSLHPHRRLIRSTPTGSGFTPSCTTRVMRRQPTGG